MPPIGIRLPIPRLLVRLQRDAVAPAAVVTIFRARRHQYEYRLTVARRRMSTCSRPQAKRARSQPVIATLGLLDAC